jgi:type II secretory pathway predicted ATPase ExeA
MYESFYALNHRPFSATPDADCCFLDAGNFRQALHELANCMVGGQGIGVLTAPAGLGKTLLCQKLVAELEGDFQPVLLSNGNYPTRRSLLQAILYELGHPYNQMGEQELRLALTSAVKEICQSREAVVIVVDEAHLLNDRLLEEIRTLTNLVERGTSLVRFVLAGQLTLDEKLAEPAFDAFNQRICSQAALEALTRQESADYIAYRLQWAGGDANTIFTPEAIEYICQAGDGSPRCLNQLCDHSLLLAYVVEAKTVDVEIVREALEDLKQLPLHWNEPTLPEKDANLPADMGRPADHAWEERRTPARSDRQVDGVQTTDFNDITSHAVFGAENGTEEGVKCSSITQELDLLNRNADANQNGEAPTEFAAFGECDELECLEVGADEPAAVEDFTTEPQTIEVGYDMDTDKQASNNGPIAPDVATGFVEEVVFDRYALLDAGKEVPAEIEADWQRTARSAVEPSSAWEPVPECRPVPPPPTTDAAVASPVPESDLGDNDLVDEVGLAETRLSELFNDEHTWAALEEPTADPFTVAINDGLDSPILWACEIDLTVGSSSEVFTSGEWFGRLESADVEMSQTWLDTNSVEVATVKAECEAAAADTDWEVGTLAADDAAAGVDLAAVEDETRAEYADESNASAAWENSTVDLDACSQLAASTAASSEEGEDEFEERVGVQALQICAETQQALLEMSMRSDSELLSDAVDSEPAVSSEPWDEPIASNWPHDGYDVVQPEAESASSEPPRSEPHRRTESLSLEPAPRETYRGPHRRSLGHLFSELRRRQRGES